MTEGESLIEELIQMEDDSVEQQKINDENTKKKADKGRDKANDMRLKAMETLRETKRCKINKGEEQEKRKRKRSIGSETFQYLREKNEMMMKFRI